jgi:hypothetical protein
MSFESRLRLDILRQPDDFSCGFTCLHAVYRYYKDEVSLDRVIAETGHLEAGGTLAVFLGCHALRRGYRATIFTYNLQVFDPTWFKPGSPPIHNRLEEQYRLKSFPHLRTQTAAYLEFLERGGRVLFEDLTTGLIRRFLKRSRPILTGLSATYLYRVAREYGPKDEPDDVRGEPTGHFVVLCGYDSVKREVLIADPLFPNPLSQGLMYSISIDRVICAILLGILTHDANLLIIEPREQEERRP